jgi:hypothetical protein
MRTFHDPQLAKMAAIAADLDASMAYEQPGFSFTLVSDDTILNPASAGESGEGIYYGQQFRFVDCTGVGTCGVPSAGGRTVGVCQNKPLPSGYSTTIVSSGILMCMTSAAVTAGNDVMVDDTGAVLPATGSVFACGVALESASGSGLIIAVLVREPRPLAA